MNTERIFYKIENNIDYVWRIVKVKNDPFRKDEFVAELLIGNIKQFINRIVKNEQDLNRYNFLDGFIELNHVDDKIIYDRELGLWRRHEKWQEIFAYRNIKGLNRIVPVSFETTVDIKSAKEILSKSINISTVIGNEIIHAGLKYYQYLCSINDYFAQVPMNSIEEFKSTIELNSVSIYGDVESHDVTYYFRPSWDEEHGLYIKFNFKTMKASYIDN